MCSFPAATRLFVVAKAGVSFVAATSCCRRFLELNTLGGGGGGERERERDHPVYITVH